jgi:hypothetical protein
MARTLRKAELWSHVTQVGVIREKTGTHGSTTVKTGAGGVAAAVSIPVTASANFADLDILMIGDAEQMEINGEEGAAADPLALKYPLFRAHPAGEPIVTGIKTVLGDIDDSGVTAGVSGGDFNAVKSATKRLVQAYLIGHLEEVIEFKVENYNLENLATAMGVSDTPAATAGPITGAGIAADPWRLVLDGTNIGIAGVPIVQAFYFTGALKGGGVVEIQAWGAAVDPTAFTAQYQRGQPALLPFRIRPCAGLSFETY